MRDNLNRFVLKLTEKLRKYISLYKLMKKLRTHGNHALRRHPVIQRDMFLPQVGAQSRLVAFISGSSLEGGGHHCYGWHSDPMGAAPGASGLAVMRGGCEAMGWSRGGHQPGAVEVAAPRCP
jgi:hypothetical protein